MAVIFGLRDPMKLDFCLQVEAFTHSYQILGYVTTESRIPVFPIVFLETHTFLLKNASTSFPFAHTSL